MRVEAVRVFKDGPLVGQSIAFAKDSERARQDLFAFVPAAFANELATRQDAFLPALIMAALVNGENVDLGGFNIDPLLLRNCLAAARQHQAWVPRFRVPEVTNYVEVPAARSISPRLASFFSGGVDSLFTLLRHSPSCAQDSTRRSDTNVSLALHVFHSADAASILRNAEAEQTLGAGAAALGASFVPVFSNVMTFDYEWNQNYARVTHSAGLASIARLLSANLSECLIASTHTYGQLQAWGSSPIVDPLYSGRDLAIQHDGSTFQRFEKTAYIAMSPAALKALNVCDQLVEQKGYVNCSRCQKCLRTMTALDLCGVTGASASAFDWTNYTSQSFGKIYFKNWNERSFAEELVQAAETRGRHDMAGVINAAIRKSRLLTPVSTFEDQVRHWPFARQSKDLLLSLRAGTYRVIGLRR